MKTKLFRLDDDGMVKVTDEIQRRLMQGEREHIQPQILKARFVASTQKLYNYTGVVTDTHFCGKSQFSVAVKAHAEC